MFDELHNNVMNYDAVTIEPKASSTTDASAVGGTGATGDATGGSNGGTGGDGSSSGGSSAPLGAGYVHTVVPEPSARAIRDHRATSPKEKIFAINPLARLFMR